MDQAGRSSKFDHSEFGYPLRLLANGSDLSSVQQVLVISEMPQSDMKEMLTDDLGMDKILSDMFYDCFGGDIYTTKKASAMPPSGFLCTRPRFPGTLGEHRQARLLRGDECGGRRRSGRTWAASLAATPSPSDCPTISTGTDMGCHSIVLPDEATYCPQAPANSFANIRLIKTYIKTGQKPQDPTYSRRFCAGSRRESCATQMRWTFAPYKRMVSGRRTTN
ncbi:pgl [Symbiodinium sp. CCMP2456]|nr:pgl [Symbiodinium sp. CCMP2456]